MKNNLDIQQNDTRHTTQTLESIRYLLTFCDNEEMRFHLRNALCAMEIVKDHYDNLLIKQGE